MSTENLDTLRARFEARSGVGSAIFGPGARRTEVSRVAPWMNGDTRFNQDPLPASGQALRLAMLRQRFEEAQQQDKLEQLLHIESVKSNGYNIRYLSAAERTPEVVRAALMNNGNAIQFLSPAERTEEMVLTAVRQNGMAVRFLTDEERTEEVVMAAVSDTPWAVQYVPPPERTEEVWLKALELEPQTARFITERDLKEPGGQALDNYLLQHYETYGPHLSQDMRERLEREAERRRVHYGMAPRYERDVM